MLIFVYYAFILCGALAALLFFVLFFRTKQPVLILSAFLWSVPIAYETWVIKTCTGECNIRVDLLVIFPFEIVVLALMSYFAWRAFKRHASPSPAT